MAGVEGLQQVGRFAAAHFADDDVIGTVPEGVTLPESRIVTAPLCNPARLEPDTVR